MIRVPFVGSDIDTYKIRAAKFIKAKRGLFEGIDLNMIEFIDVQGIDNEWIQPLINAGINDYLLDIHWTAFMKTAKLAPKSEWLLRVFSMPISKIRIVIIGQDPYPTEGDAIGYSFATNNPIGTSSLKNIFAEVSRDFTLRRIGDYSLSGWINQGVFLLNTCLAYYIFPQGTKEPQCIEREYWSTFTSSIIGAIQNTKPNVKFLLMGSHARNLMKTGVIKRPNNCCIVGHPSTRNTEDPFVGSGCFVTINNMLSESKLQPIDWGDNFVDTTTK